MQLYHSSIRPENGKSNDTRQWATLCSYADVDNTASDYKTIPIISTLAFHMHAYIYTHVYICVYEQKQYYNHLGRML